MWANKFILECVFGLIQIQKSPLIHSFIFQFPLTTVQKYTTEKSRNKQLVSFKLLAVLCREMKSHTSCLPHGMWLLPLSGRTTRSMLLAHESPSSCLGYEMTVPVLQSLCSSTLIFYIIMVPEHKNPRCWQCRYAKEKSYSTSFK